MFWHIYRVKLKCIARNRQLLFWTIMFPLILATFFQLALSNLASHEAFERIPVAMVQSPALDAEPIFRQVLASVSEGEDALLSVTFADRAQAEELLQKREVEGIIDFTPELGMTVLQSGINQTILKGFLDDYLQTSKTVNGVFAADRLGALTRLSDILRRDSYIQDAPVNESVKDPYVTFFYALIAMTCLYGGFLCMEEVNRASADVSAQGMRTTLAPTHKMVVILSAMAAAFTVQLIEISLLMFYLSAILRVSFGGQMPWIALACVAGTLCGASFGAMIGCVVRGGEGVKIGAMIGISMLMSYMAGLMDFGITYAINQKAPIIALLNPASLINGCFSSLYYGPNMARYTQNLLLLLALTAAFGLIAYGRLRRKKYASV